MKVVHYCDAFSLLSETFIYDCIIELERNGVHNNVFTNKIVNPQQRPFSKVNLLNRRGINVLSKIANKVIVKTGIYDGRKLSFHYKRKELYTKLLKEKPDLIHAHYGPQGCIVLPVALKLKIPLVVSFHGFDAFKLPGLLFWKNELSKLFKSVQAITVVSKAMCQHLISLGCPPHKIYIIHVGKKLPDYPRRSREKDGIREFISIGRLVEKKGHLDCISAFEKTLENYPNLSLTIVGSGPQLQVLEKFVNDHSLQNSVKLVGDLDHDKARQLLYNSDAFILCSKTASDGDREGIPTVLMEAQAIGLPCISTTHSGIPEVIPEESHWLLAEENNITSIREKIEILLRSSNESLDFVISEGRKKIEEEFDVEIETKKLNELYLSQLENAHNHI